MESSYKVCITIFHIYILEMLCKAKNCAVSCKRVGVMMYLTNRTSYAVSCIL